VVIQAIHWIQWFSGGKFVEVAARQTAQGNRGHGELESSGVCLFRLSNSGAAMVSFNYFRPRSAPTHGEDRLRVAGEKGVVEVAEAEATVCTNYAPLRRLAPDEPVSIFQEFMRHIETGAPMRMSAEEAFALCELSLRAREAADTGASIRVGTQEGKS
jgi:predicted dehydrogenase